MLEEKKMKRTIKDFDLEGKKIIIRCDLNVPIENGVITDDTRIVASLRTIKYALRFNTKIILLSHLGKIKTEEDKKKNSLYPVVERLREYLKVDEETIVFGTIGTFSEIKWRYFYISNCIFQIKEIM